MHPVKNVLVHNGYTTAYYTPLDTVSRYSQTRGFLQHDEPRSSFSYSKLVANAANFVKPVTRPVCRFARWLITPAPSPSKT
jgi:hypothetical protein